MKKILIVFACLLGLIATGKAQVTLRIDAGLLQNSTGTQVVQNGMLLQLIASPSGTFSAPTSSSYITGDNILLGNFAMNSNSQQAGETLNNTTLSLSTSNYTLTTGEKVLLRFYPNLSLASAPATPTLGTNFGQVRSDTIESGITDASQAAWVIPSNGATVDLLYITTSAGGGGSYANSSAFATGVVGVPEPSTTGIFGGTIVGLMALAKFRRRSA